MKLKRIMRDINDDMDDLFRRAADNYPLNTNGSDWNKVQNAMQSSENASAQNGKNKKKNRRFFWLLLLLPVAFVIDKYGFQHHDKENGITHQPTALEQTNISPGKTDKENFNKEGEKEPSLLRKESLSAPAKIVQNKNSDERLTRANESKNVRNKHSLKQNVAAAQKVLTEHPNEEVIKDFAIIENKNKNPTVINNDFEATEDKNVVSPNIKQESADTLDKDEKKGVEKPAVNNDTLKISVAKTYRQINVKKNKSHSFYIGVVAGPDLSTVKLGKIIKTGYTVGGIAGYRFNKRVSVESGLLLDKKYYYSEGKYFNPKNSSIPYHATVENVRGYCKMIELPLNVKYDFKSNKKVSWFAVAGISSYFMNKENYDYRYSIYGQQQEGNLSVKDASKIWASVMNLSVGYSHSLGKTGTLRIEPYIKVPFRGVGIGSLPITSSGIYFGFTKNLF